MRRSEIKTRTPLKRGKGLKRATKPMARKARLKARKTPRAFRQRRDPAYAQWMRAQLCLLAGSKVTIAGLVTGRYFISPNVAYWHSCMGPVQSCHVKSRGAGGDDRANVVPLCAGAHEEQHRIGIRSFQVRWGVDLQAEAARLVAVYQRETGAP